MKPIRCGRYAFTLAQVALLVSAGAVQAGSNSVREDNDWQHRRLFNPTPSELAAEASGQIVIYAGMQDVDVSRALDAQFGRVESMMFIRTQITDDKGAVVDEEDEGC